jgi:hypothetical protein
MLRSADAGLSRRLRADDPVRAVQPAERRLNVSPATQRPSPEATAELLSASTFNPLSAADSKSSAKGQTSSMRELVQIDSPSEHACGQPSTERLHVLEPVSGRWSWIRVFGCCNVLAVEPIDTEEQTQPAIKRAA